MALKLSVCQKGLSCLSAAFKGGRLRGWAVQSSQRLICIQSLRGQVKTAAGAADGGEGATVTKHRHQVAEAVPNKGAKQWCHTS